MTLRRKAALLVGGATLVFLVCDHFNRLDTLFYTGAAMVLFSVIGLTARLLAAVFSSKAARQIREHPELHLAWGLLALFCVYWRPRILVGIIPSWVERSEQRRALLKRVDAAGGWDAIREGCQTLVSKNPDDVSWWLWDRKLVSAVSTQSGFITNIASRTVPVAIEQLSPRYINLETIREFPDGKVLRMKVLTGRRSYCGLEVVLGTNAAKYRPELRPSEGYAEGYSWSYRKVADGIYEIY